MTNFTRWQEEFVWKEQNMLNDILMLMLSESCSQETAALQKSKASLMVCCQSKFYHMSDFLIDFDIFLLISGEMANER